MDIPFIKETSAYYLLIFCFDLFIRITISLRVIMRKRAYSVTFAWLFVILLVPFLGGIAYILMGESRLPSKRVQRAKLSYDIYISWLKSLKDRAPVNSDQLLTKFLPIRRQAEKLVQIPTLGGNTIELLTTPETIIGSLLEAINSAEYTCHLEFYIWQEGGRIDEVNQALIKAADRGVTCRLLLDSIGSRQFLNSRKALEMKAAGIHIEASLPTGIISAFFSRMDIRNHRKIAVFDGQFAYTGSQNMVDPACFKKEAGVGNWVDMMAKINGPAVEALAGTFYSDWFLEQERRNLRATALLKDLAEAQQEGNIMPQPEKGAIPIQLVPSGPGPNVDTIRNLLLTTIYSAQNELICTTPYFIPGEPLLVALKSAAERGVRVKIIVPAENDSKMVHYASRARYDELIRAGIEIYLFSGGLLHSKTLTVDGELSLFGSVNLDMRSFWLNFEATLFIYNDEFTRELREEQYKYLARSSQLDLEEFCKRSTFERFKENLCLLVSPIL